MKTTTWFITEEGQKISKEDPKYSFEERDVLFALSKERKTAYGIQRLLLTQKEKHINYYTIVTCLNNLNKFGLVDKRDKE